MALTRIVGVLGLLSLFAVLALELIHVHPPALTATVVPSLDSHNTVFAPGGSIFLSGRGFPPGHRVAFLLDGVPGIHPPVTADQYGYLHARIHLPATTPPGVRTISATMGANEVAASTIIVVISTSSAPRKVRT